MEDILLIFVGKKIKNLYKTMSTFEKDIEYQNKLQYAYDTYVRRTMLCHICLLNVFGFEFCLMMLIVGKKNALMIILLSVLGICSIIFIANDVDVLDDSVLNQINNVSRKNYKIIKNVDEDKVQVQEYLFVDITGDIILREDYVFL